MVGTTLLALCIEDRGGRNHPLALCIEDRGGRNHPLALCIAVWGGLDDPKVCSSVIPSCSTRAMQASWGCIRMFDGTALGGCSTASRYEGACWSAAGRATSCRQEPSFQSADRQVVAPGTQTDHAPQPNAAQSPFRTRQFPCRPAPPALLPSDSIASQAAEAGEVRPEDARGGGDRHVCGGDRHVEVFPGNAGRFGARCRGPSGGNPTEAEVEAQ